jgi:DNA replication initiation complex subunit (GINS family)
MLYNELYEIWKKEKMTKNELQNLPSGFYVKIAAYIKKMKEENRMLDRKTTKAKLLDNEFRNVKAMVKEVFVIRYTKFQNIAFNSENVSKNVLTEEEKKLYGEVASFAEGCHVFSKDILRGILSVTKKGEKQGVTVLRFVQEIPALVGSDMKTYGPFAPEDVATLPLDNARVLITQGVAVEVASN